MEKIIGKAEHSNKWNFPQKHKIDKNIKIDEIANESNKYFTDIGPSLAKNTLYLSTLFKRFFKENQHYQLAFSNKQIEKCFFFWD